MEMQLEIIALFKSSELIGIFFKKKTFHEKS